MEEFLVTSLSRAGADTMVTPREIIRDYVTLLDLLYSNPGKTFSDIAGTMQHTVAAAEDAPSADTAANPGAKVTLDDLEF